MKQRAARSLFIILLALFLTSSLGAKEPLVVNTLPPWVKNLDIPKQEPIYLVIKGMFPDRKSAEVLQGFIQQIMGKTPGDGVDLSDVYQGLPRGKYIVGMLFDTKERAQWWMDFSYRNRKISRGTLKEVVILQESHLPYMPSASRPRSQTLISEQDALLRVQQLADVQQLTLSKKLQFKFTDYPRNGDLRYEVEILEDRGPKEPLMLDFVMVSALDGQVVERLSRALGRRSIAP